MSFLFLNKALRHNNLKTRRSMNAIILVFVICVKVIIYLLFCYYNSQECTFKLESATHVPKLWVWSLPIQFTFFLFFLPLLYKSRISFTWLFDSNFLVFSCICKLYLDIDHWQSIPLQFTIIYYNITAIYNKNSHSIHNAMKYSSSSQKCG